MDPVRDLLGLTADYGSQFIGSLDNRPICHIRALGRDGIAGMVERCCDHAVRFDLLGANPEVQILNDVVLNQVLVRFGDDDALTEATVKGVQEEGTCWLSGTVWQGKAAMRISVSNGRTTNDDVERSAVAIREAAARVAGTVQAT